MFILLYMWWLHKKEWPLLCRMSEYNLCLPDLWSMHLQISVGYTHEVGESRRPLSGMRCQLGLEAHGKWLILLSCCLPQLCNRTSWIREAKWPAGSSSIARGILACVRESLHKANVTLDLAATDCFRKERRSSRSCVFGDEPMCTLAKAVSVPT